MRTEPRTKASLNALYSASSVRRSEVVPAESGVANPSEAASFPDRSLDRSFDRPFDRSFDRPFDRGEGACAVVPRTAVKNISWLRRTGRRATGALLGAMLVGSSFALSGSGASDHSAMSVPRPAASQSTPATAGANLTPERPSTPTAPPAIPPTTPPPKTPEEIAIDQLEATLRAGNMRIEYRLDFADPFVLRAGEQTYFYATNAHFANVPVLDTKAMLEGAAPRDALPTENLGAWAVPNISHVWAPSVAALNDGRFAMFYSAKEKSSGLMAVGVAFANSPLGPFRDASAVPLLSAGNSGAAGRGGVIDASVFQENGRTFVVFKNDGNSSRAETAVWLQEFSEATGAVQGAPAKLLGDAGRQNWEVAAYTRPHALIEGPRLIAAEGKYYLFYCANDWASADYGVNYAVADSLAGPYTRAPGPWMQSEEGRFGPGGPEIFGAAGRLFLAYHAWDDPTASYAEGDARRLVIEPLTFEQGTPARPLA